VKLNNQYGLPQTLINLHNKQRREYAETKDTADMSVTQLIRSPRIDLLRKTHWHEMEEDIADRLWAILGTVIHRIMEEGGDEIHLTEENLRTVLEGYEIKGGIDVVKKGNRFKILDYKFTRAIKFQKQDYTDWEEQLNLYRWLAWKVLGFDIDELEVVMFVRDFAQGFADTQKNYPRASAVPIKIKMWPLEKAEAFLRERILMHQDARRAVEWGEDLPLCTDEDRWKRGSKWIVMKKGGKRAAKIAKDAKEAGEWKMSKKKPDDYEVIERHDKPSRCMGVNGNGYCGVAKWCDQWQADKHNYEEDKDDAS